MKRLGVLMMVVVMTAVALPTVASLAQIGGDCRRGVEVEGRCLSVDEQAATCRPDAPDTACVEFVEQSVDVCPDNAVPIGPGVDICELTEPAVQRAPNCPDGARGEADACFIYVATGPDGCPPVATLDVDGNCRRPVSNGSRPYFCERADAALTGTTCTALVDPIPSPCPARTTRFDAACWRLNGLSTPQSCAGFDVAGTTQLASGRCHVPLPIPTGAASCQDGARFVETPTLMFINEDNERQGPGPLTSACIDDVVLPGIAVASCTFLDDDYDWGDWGDYGDDGGKLCTRFEIPASTTCAPGFSIDDSIGSTCARSAFLIDGECPDGGEPSGAVCLFFGDFATFVCPAETERHPDYPICRSFRPYVGSIVCSIDSVLLVDDPISAVAYACVSRLGPQPNACNGIGTIDACFQEAEPAPVSCAAASGCLQVGDFRILGDVTCDADVTLLDALVIAQYAIADRTAAATCSTLAPASQAFTYDGDLDNNGTVDNDDALLLLQCQAGLNDTCD